VYYNVWRHITNVEAIENITERLKRKPSSFLKAHLEIIDGKFCIDIENYITTESIILQISMV
jgi:hypothetical protein